MKRGKYITDSELKILKIIWDAGEPISIRDITIKLEKQVIFWKNRTMLSFLRNMEQKEVVSKIKRGVTNYYYPLIEREGYVQEEMEKFLDAYFKGSVSGFLSAFCKQEDISEEEIRIIKRWVNDFNE